VQLIPAGLPTTLPRPEIVTARVGGPVGGRYEVLPPPKAVVPWGVPSPVGPSYPSAAVHR